MATRALRGEYSPEDPTKDNERSSTALLSALVHTFPTRFSFKAVCSLDQLSADDVCDALVKSIRDDSDVDDVVDVRLKTRSGGRFASVAIECIVPSPEVIQDVYDLLNAEPVVTMTF